MYRDSAASTPLVLTIAGYAVEARDRRTGEIVWRFHMPETENGWASRARCVMAGDRVVVAHLAEGKREGFLGTKSVECAPCVTCLARDDGAPIWTHELPGRINVGHFGATLVVDAGQVLVATLNTLFALGVEDGALHWSAPVGGGTQPHVSVGIAVDNLSVHADR